MTRSNRFVNRLLLLLVGLASLAAGAWLALRTEPLASRSPIALPDIPQFSTTGWWIVAASALAAAVLATAWAVTRGRGRVDAVVRTPDLTISARVAADLLEPALLAQPDVAAVRTRVFRVRGRRAIEVRVATRPGAALPPVIETARRAVAVLDAALELTTPVALHVTPATFGGDAGVRRVD
jgi:hypothetical protein